MAGVAGSPAHGKPLVDFDGFFSDITDFSIHGLLVIREEAVKVDEQLSASWRPRQETEQRTCPVELASSPASKRLGRNARPDECVMKENQERTMVCP